MFVDARMLPPGASLAADLCIVGAGPAGITLALELMDTGARVLLLESGGVKPEVLAKHLDRGSSVGYQYHNLMFTRARSVGGTSSRWHMHAAGDEGWMARPLDPVDLEAREAVPESGWPFDYAHLEPYFARAYRRSDLGAPTCAVEDWERPGMERLPLAEDRIVTLVLQRGMTSFARYRDTLAVSATITVVYHATVTEIESEGEPALVTRVRAASDHDHRFSVEAPIFVLAAGGIENPRLLMASRGHWPAGLGNGNDLVGRYFMEHLAGRVGIVRSNGTPVVSMTRLYDSHPEGEIFVQAALALNENLMRGEGLLNAAFFMLPRTAAFASEGVRSLRALTVGTYRRPRARDTLGHVQNVVRDARPIARTVLNRLSRSGTGEVLVVRVQAEQSPNRDSRITLGSARDRLGTPRPVLDWRVNDDDIRSIRRSEDVLDDELRRAGLGRIERKLGEEEPPVVFEGNHHHIGTTRMSSDPGRGVVDADGLIHGVRNMYVAGSSVFPTGGFTNPTFTIVAMAIRLADHLRGRIGAR